MNEIQGICGYKQPSWINKEMSKCHNVIEKNGGCNPLTHLEPPAGCGS